MKAFFLFIFLVILSCLIWVSWRITTISNEPSLVTQTGSEAVATQQDDILFRFLVFGDNESNLPVLKKVLQKAQELQVDFVINTGDTTANGTKKEFAAYAKAIQDFPLPIYDTVGNDDIGTDGTLDLYHQYLEKETYYSFDKGPYHFVSVYNVGESALLPNQLQWLTKDLAKTDKKIVLFFHKPIDLPFADVVEYNDFIPDERVASFTALLPQYPIVQMFAGHAHTYFTYKIGSIPLTVTGGGGGEPNVPEFFQLSSLYHVVVATARQSGITTEVVEIQ